MEAENKSKPHHGFNVKVARNRKRLKQSALGLLLRMSQDQISRLENQEVIEDEMLGKIAEALDCSVDYLKSEDLESLIGSYGGPTINNKDSVHENTLTTGENANVKEYVQQKSETIQGQTIINEPIKELKEIYDKYASSQFELGKITTERDLYKDLYEKSLKK